MTRKMPRTVFIEAIGIGEDEATLTAEELEECEERDTQASWLLRRAQPSWTVVLNFIYPPTTYGWPGSDDSDDSASWLQLDDSDDSATDAPRNERERTQLAQTRELKRTETKLKRERRNEETNANARRVTRGNQEALSVAIRTPVKALVFSSNELVYRGDVMTDNKQRDQLLQLLAQLRVALRMPGGRGLTSLDVSCNCMMDAGAAILADALNADTCGLISLDVRHSVMGDKGAMVLANALCKQTCKLIDLDISHNVVRDDGAAAMAHALCTEGCVLSHLSLRDNQVWTEGMVALALALRTDACTLTSLDVSTPRLQYILFITGFCLASSCSLSFFLNNKYYKYNCVLFF